MKWINDKGTKIWGKTTDALTVAKNRFAEERIGVTEKIRIWIVILFVKAIDSCSSEQDKLEVIAWLALVRKILEDSSLSFQYKAKEIYRLIDSKKTIQIVFRSVIKAVDNYKNSDLPLPVKIAIPATLTGAALIGGQGAGIAAFGGAIGMPVVLLIFLGTAGITAIIEPFLGKPESQNYISIVRAMISKDKLLVQLNETMKEVMTSVPAEPKEAAVPDEETELRKTLVEMDSLDFKRHVMSFFQSQGMLSWITKKPINAAIDGFARHSSGLIVVQCRQIHPDISVAMSVVEEFKYIIEENKLWRGYIVTTGSFSDDAKESVLNYDRIVLIDMDALVEWHSKGIFDE